MKKCIAVLLALVMLVSLCACTTESAYKGTKEELEGIVDMIAQIPIATMGVSITITNRAVELLDWCEATSMSGEDVADTVKAYYDALDADAQSLFLEQVAVTVNDVGTLSNEETRASVLETAGFSKTLTWDEQALSLAACIDDRL